MEYKLLNKEEMKNRVNKYMDDLEDLKYGKVHKIKLDFNNMDTESIDPLIAIIKQMDCYIKAGASDDRQYLKKNSLDPKYVKTNGQYNLCIQNKPQNYRARVNRYELRTIDFHLRNI